MIKICDVIIIGEVWMCPEMRKKKKEKKMLILKQSVMNLVLIEALLSADH